MWVFCGVILRNLKEAQRRDLTGFAVSVSRFWTVLDHAHRLSLTARVSYECATLGSIPIARSITSDDSPAHNRRPIDSDPMRLGLSLINATLAGKMVFYRPRRRGRARAQPDRGTGKSRVAECAGQRQATGSPTEDPGHEANCCAESPRSRLEANRR
jgi:hypothetical protein